MLGPTVGDAGSISTLTFTRSDSNYPYFYAIRVDGVTLIDSTTTNLSFNNGSTSRWMETHCIVLKTNLVMETIGLAPMEFGGSNSVDKATGAIPILNTNESGTVAKGGVRTDTKTYTVTASGGKYYLDGVEKPTLNFLRGGTYIFDYTAASSHPF